MSAIRRSHANLPSLGYMGDGSVSWRREAGGRGLELVLRTCTTCTCSPLLAKTFLLGLWDFFESQTSRDRTTQCFSPPSSASGPRCPAPAETNDSRSSLPARVRHEECSTPTCSRSRTRRHCSKRNATLRCSNSLCRSNPACFRLRPIEHYQCAAFHM